MALLSDGKHNQEELRIENEAFCSSLDPSQFQALCEGLGEDLGMGFLPADSQSQYLEMEEQRLLVAVNFNNNVTSRHVSCIARTTMLSPTLSLLLTSHTASPPIVSMAPSRTDTSQPASFVPITSYTTPIAHMNTPQPTSAPLVLSPQMQNPHDNSSSPVLATPISQLKTQEWPHWFKTWYSVFSNLPFGNTWHKLIALWVNLEYSYGFISPVSINRPSYDRLSSLPHFIY